MPQVEYSILRLTATQHAQIRQHLYAGDGNESVAIALCGTHRGNGRAVFCVHSVKVVPNEICLARSADRVVWPIEPFVPVFAEAARKNMAVLKIHSHPSGYRHFSKFDDESDRALLGSLVRLAPVDTGHVSAVMLPDGGIFARIFTPKRRLRRISRVTVVGDEIVQHGSIRRTATADGAFIRTIQAFGRGTVSTLSQMRIGVVGCSGTGSWVVEMLARLGVSELVLVDPDHVERKNLNRIVNSTAADAETGRMKVKVFVRAIRRMGLGTRIHPFAADLLTPKVVSALASCDLVFGCVDSADGRDALNRIAAFYTIPYIDVGVHLSADGRGGVQQIVAAVHYLIPDGSSLLSRRVITSEQVRADSLRRRAPQQYESLRKEGYIQGVSVASPAVISINGFAASHAVNEMLARIHPFRRDSNSEYRHQTFSLPDGAWIRVDDGSPCPYLSKRTGRGDCRPPLDNSELG